MPKEQLINFKRNNVKYSIKEANRLLEKNEGLTFKEIQERDDLLTYKRLMEEDIEKLKENKE